MIGAIYSGTVSKGKINGIFSQHGRKFPLSLTPEESLSERRPQTPVPPFPYIEKDTVFFSSDGTELAGTLTIPHPELSKKIPAVVMVTGSGPQNRDEELFEHRPFAVIADYLARNGIASFRYDDPEEQPVPKEILLKPQYTLSKMMPKARSNLSTGFQSSGKRAFWDIQREALWQS